MEYKGHHINVKKGKKFNFLIYYTFVNGRKLKGWADTKKEAIARGKQYICKYEDKSIFDKSIKHLTWYHKIWVIPFNKFLTKMTNIINKVGRYFGEKR